MPGPVRLVKCPVCKKFRWLRLKIGHKTVMKCTRCYGKLSPERKAQIVKYVKDRKKRDPEYKAHMAELHAEHRRRLRLQIIAGYGGKCQCCGERREEFLCLDHVKGGGDKDRKRSGGQPAVFYRIKRRGFPKGYRILCCNCNMVRVYRGYCPHEKERNKTK